MVVEVRVLGGVTAHRDGGAVDLGGRVLTRALTVLAAQAPRSATLDDLRDHVWPEGAPPTATKALRVHVARLRQALGAPAITTTAGGYRLDDAVEVDLLRYADSVADAERVADRDPWAAIDHLDAALRTWRGVPFGDQAADPWLAAQVDHLLERHRIVEERHSDLTLAVGREASHLDQLRRRAAAEPLRERRWAQLITALHRTGLDADAARAYDACRAVLGEELGVAPGALVQAAYDDAIIRSGHRADGPARPGGPLVGRGTELQAVEQRLAEHPVVTLLGIGGIGKSRLAQEVLRRRRARADATARLQVRPGSGDHLAQDLAAQAGSVVDTRDEAVDALVTGLVGVELVLIDGAERALDAVADLVTRMRVRRPRLRVLLTSREPLGIDGEVHLTLGPLPVPAAGETWVGTAAELLARHRGLTGDPTAADAVGVLEDCVRAAGVPLLLELAARSGLAEAVVDLDDRNVEQSVRELVEALDGPGQELARALAVVPGGTTVALLHRLGSADRAVRKLVWLGLATTGLRGESLRYDMLDPVRAAVRADVSAAEADALVRRTVQHLCEVGHRHRPSIADPPDHDALPAADAEIPTLRALLTDVPWARLPLAEATADVLGLRGLTGEALAALTETRLDDDPHVAARATLTAARIGRFGTTLGGLAEDLRVAIDVFREAGDDDAAVVGALYAVVAHVQRGDVAAARALATFTEDSVTGDWLAGNVAIARGFVTAMEGAPLDGIDLLHEAEGLLVGIDMGAAAFAAYVTGVVGGFVLAPDALTDFRRARTGAEAIGDLPLAALCRYAELELRRRKGDLALPDQFRALARDCEQAGLRDRAAQAHLLAGSQVLGHDAAAARSDLLAATTLFVRAGHQMAAAAVAGLAAAIASADPDLALHLATAARSMPAQPGYPLSGEDHALAQELLAFHREVPAAPPPSTAALLDLVDAAAEVEG